MKYGPRPEQRDHSLIQIYLEYSFQIFRVKDRSTLFASTWEVNLFYSEKTCDFIGPLAPIWLRPYYEISL